MEYSKTQIIATIGPASKDKKIMREMIDSQMDLCRLNFSWGNHEEHKSYIDNIRQISGEANRKIPIIVDLSGPRIQEESGHEFDEKALEVITSKDIDDLKFALEQNVDYIAMSFVGSANDVLKLREEMKIIGKVIPIISKIERKIAIDNLNEIINTSDAIMIARGDLGNEIPLEKIPFIQKEIINRCKEKNKPVIVATQMMLSMTNNPVPTRAEVTDVAYAITSGADAIMLSEETASGKYPVEAIKMMERISIESERYFKQTLL